TLEKVPGISRTGAPELPPPPLKGGDGASVDGLVGDDIHADVHTIRLAGAAGPDRQVWVGCDGGGYVSGRAGPVGTLAAGATVRQSPLVGRLAVGTNRVWLSDDLGSGADNTWTVLPYGAAPATATNPRVGGLDAAADQKTGVPGGGALPAVAAGGVGPLGEV